MKKHPTKKSLVYADAEHVRLARGLYAMVGPFNSHHADEELQREIEVAVARYNTKHGYMPFGRAPM